MAIERGYRKFICVGGDGTFHNIVNGIMKQNMVPSKEITVAMVTVGTGNDWVRTSGVPRKYEESTALIDTGSHIFHDVGTVTTGNNPKLQYFINFGGIGFDALMVQNLHKSSRIGKSAYYLSLVTSLFEYQSQVLQIDCAEGSWNERCFIVLAGIGKYGGAGMKFCPGAILDDGQFYLTLIKDVSKMEVIWNLPGLFSGSMINHPKVDTVQTKALTISAPNAQKTVYMEADGELMGESPFDIGLVPGAIRVVVPS